MRTTIGILTLLLVPSLAGAQELTGACGEFEVGGLAYAWRPCAIEAGSGARIPVREHEALEVLGLPGALRARHPGAVRVCSGERLRVRRAGERGRAVEGTLALEDLALAFVPAGGSDALLLGRGPRPRTFELRLIDFAGRRLAATPLEPVLTTMGDGDDRYVPSLEWLGEMGFAGIDGVALARFDYEACGYNNPVVPVLLLARRLVVGPEADHVAEAGLYHADAELLFPSDAGGLAQGLVLRTVVETFDEASSDYIEDSVETRAWRLEGGRFVESRP